MWFWYSGFWDVLDRLFDLAGEGLTKGGSSGDGMRRPDCTNPYILEKRRRRARGALGFTAVIAALFLLWHFFPQISDAASKYLPH